MDDEAAAGVCYRAKPLDMAAPLVVAQLPGPSTFSQRLGLQVPFGGEGDWQTNQDASLERGLPQVETQAEAERLGALPRGLALDENQLGRSLAKLLKLDTVAQGLTRPVMTLISRRNKRLILNEDELVRVATDMGMEVQLVALESMPLYDQVKAFQRTAVLVGIHGSGLINSIFLPSGAAIVQLMPHGVQKGAAFFKNTALGAGVKYLEWSNPKRDNAVLHWEFVGEDKQGQADSMLQVGDGCCGEGTFFSFWINQDTRVDPADFASILGNALRASSFKPAEQAR
ncbi:pomgnt2 [Symbiodinium sp. KB8]|nr:pomgnt2 [Symbiodinium sp. KB8]